MSEFDSPTWRTIVHSPENAYRKSLLCECVSAYLPIDEEQRQQYEEMLRNHPDSGVQAMQLGFLDHIEQRGELRGELRGVQIGVLKGQRDLLCEQLEARFGSLPPTARAKLEAWPGEKLTELGRALVLASSLDELGLGTTDS